jgi:hypothetical protein
VTSNNRRRFVFAIAAGAEIASGLAMIAAPAMMIDLMFKSGGAAAIVMARVAGSALLCLGLACCPRARGNDARAAFALLGYNALVTVYLIRLGLTSAWNGPLLWPSVALHGVLAGLLAWMSRTPTASSSPNR